MRTLYYVNQKGDLEMKSCKFKHLLSLLLTFVLVFQAGTTAFASDIFSDEAVKIEVNSDNSLSIKTNDSENTIVVTDNNGIRTITITDIETGKIEYIQYNENTNTVYSSMTNETIDISENEELAPIESNSSARSVTSYEITKISYAQIKKIVGNVANAALVIGAILYFVPGASSIGGAASAVGTIVSTLNSTVSASSKHGIKLKVKVTKYYRGTTSNKHVYKTVRSIQSGSLY